MEGIFVDSTNKHPGFVMRGLCLNVSWIFDSLTDLVSVFDDVHDSELLAGPSNFFASISQWLENFTSNAWIIPFQLY